MSLTQSAILILGLLLTPGPTNSLMAIAGAERGWLRSLRLIPAELLGYLSSTVPLAFVGAQLIDELPTVRTSLTAVAGVWVLYLALAMWRRPPSVDHRDVTARRVAVTTFLNPKGLVFGLVLLPATELTQSLARFAIFIVLVILVAMAWASLGATLRTTRPGVNGLPDPWRRAASVWLALLALYLLGRVVGLA